MFRQFILVLAMTLLGVLGVASADAYAQDTAQVRIKNVTTGTSLSTSYTHEAYANAGDNLEIQLTYLSLGSAQNTSFMSITLPDNVTYNSSYTPTGSDSTNVSGQTITFSFNPTTTNVVVFRANVKSGNQLSTTHTETFSFTTNGLPASSTSSPSSNPNATLRIGPVLTVADPASAKDVNATDVTLTGHGFAETGDSITSILLSDGTDILPGAATVTSIGNGLYTIDGIRVPSGLTNGTYQIKLTISNGGKSMTTGIDTAHTVQFSITDGTAPLMSTADSYTHSSGELILDFDEAIDASNADASKITLYDANSGGNSLALTGATVAAGASTDKLSVTLTQSQKNTIAGWQSASNVYVQLSAGAVSDTSSNALAAQASRTAIASWTKDSTAPTISSFSITQNSVTTTNVYAGAITLSLTLSEVASTSPVISIDQPGTTDITNDAMTTADNTTYTYTYTVVASSTPTYLDGTATVTISGAEDYGGNAMVSDSSNTFTIDTDTPNPAISTLTAGVSDTSSVALSWTPTYTESDFSTYKVYYRTSTGVTSSNGTLVSKNTSGQSALGTSSTTGTTISSLSSGTTYFFVIYICDTSDNCSPISNEVTKTTAVQAGNVSVSSGGGGGGGGSIGSTPATSASKTIASTGGTISMNISDGSEITAIASNETFTESTVINIVEATNTQKTNAPVVATSGALIGNNAYDVTATLGSAKITQLPAPITIAIKYTSTQVGGDVSKLRVAYYNETTKAWVPLVTTVDTSTRTASAQVSHLTLFGLINYTTDVPQEESATSSSTGSSSDTTDTTEDSGTVLGSSTGVYPNGSLLVAQGTPAVWYISGDEKHLIRSAAVFESRFNWNDVITLPSSRQLDLYAQGADVTFAPGVLVKEQGSPSVYRITDTGSKQPIVSLEVFLNRGYNFDQVIEVEPNGLASYETLAALTDTSILDGDLVKVAGNPAVYYVQAGKTRLIPHEAIFVENAFSFSDVRTVPLAEFALLGTGSEMTYPDGTLIKGSDASVYVIADGKKRPIVSGQDFEALLYNWDHIVFVPDVLITRIDTAATLQLVQADQDSIDVASIE